MLLGRSHALANNPTSRITQTDVNSTKNRFSPPGWQILQGWFGGSSVQSKELELESKLAGSRQVEWEMIKRGRPAVNVLGGRQLAAMLLCNSPLSLGRTKG